MILTILLAKSRGAHIALHHNYCETGNLKRAMMHLYVLLNLPLLVRFP